ncbi:hypothetical protein V2I52_16870 [Brenneria sp. g21c3]|uniref:hypothetical protein n=1 Tax=Brenneria sp. g21c3 TaxID=3093893 RepID=UPI002EAD50DD|nr:hypothetical protein [Brenneria sp. g21c3]
MNAKQVEFPEEYILDVGLIPCFEIDDKFHGILIKGYDLHSPIYSGNADNLVELKEKINKALVLL